MALMFNQVIISGRLTGTPELRQTQNGTFVTGFTLAVGRKMKREETDFFSCVAWSATAEFVCRNFEKGNPMMVVGYMQNRNWTDKDGNQRQLNEVVVNDVYFVEGKKMQNEQIEESVKPDFETVKSALTPDSDLPF